MDWSSTTNNPPTSSAAVAASESAHATQQFISFLVQDFLSPLQVRSPINETTCLQIIASAKVLLKLVQNALRATSTSTATATATATAVSTTQDKYLKIKLSNKIIKEKVVQQSGAMDLLTAVGFVYDDTTPTNDQILVFSPNDEGQNATFFCVSMQEELVSSTSTLQQTQEQEQMKMKMNRNRKNQSQSTNQDNDKDGFAFLSEKERMERRIRALKSKKAKAEERKLAQLRWKEDEDHRREIRKRKEMKMRMNHGAKQESRAGGEVDHVSTSFSDVVTAEGAIKKLKIGGGVQSKEESIQSLRAKAQANWKKKCGKNHEIVEESIDQVDISNVSNTVTPKPDEIESESVLVQSDHEEATKEPSKHVATNPSTPPSDETLLNQNIKQDQSLSWEECLKNIPRCGPSHNIRNSSVFYKGSTSPYATASSSPKCFRRLFAELNDLETSLPSNIQCSTWLRFDEDSPQYIRALLTAPLPGPSPYAGGVFAFDIYIPDDYPYKSPNVNIITTGKGTVRFGPNLYADGKVCLSLLGTWSGPKWNPKQSSLLQVLVSIQSLILGVEHPYYLEPGYGGWEAQIKEGDFATVGHTLKGDVVREEMALPGEVWKYEDKIRVGCIRHAMIEPLVFVAKDGNEDQKQMSSNSFLLPFENVIQAHFYHNGNEILESVRGWLKASRPASSSRTVDLLHTLFPKLESAMDEICYPPTTMDESSAKIAAKKVEEMQIDTFVSQEGKPKAIVESESKSDIEKLRDEMKKAVEANNFILAGHIQKEILKIEEDTKKVDNLKQDIEAAAQAGDYIKAGDLQSQLQTYEGNHTKSKPSSFGSIGGNDNQINNVNHHESNYDSEDDFHEEDNSFEQEDMDEYDEYPMNSSKLSHWGSGYQLGGSGTSNECNVKSAVIPPIPTKDNTTNKIVIHIPRLPVVEECRLRIRFPDSTVQRVLEESFDSSEKLITLYKCVRAYITNDSSLRNSSTPRLRQLQGISNHSGSQAIGVSSGAFSNPQSEFGFTLLTTHPKREYSLEMHGTMSLKDLKLVPSATLTVMMCSSRGQVKRGILESKLHEAQGDAMDVDGLGYEALQELGEKIGIAAPGDGAWKGIDEDRLGKISKLISPKDYLMQKSTHRDDMKCPICLGLFDATESDTQLIILEHCGHTFHLACLKTWLSTKTNCPVCKYSLSEEK